MNVSKSEFQAFVRQSEKRDNDLRALLQQILNRAPPTISTTIQDAPGGAASPFSNFQGVLPRPNSGRSSQRTSFINVGSCLKAGIDAYNASLPADNAKIKTNELDGSLLSWSHSVFSTVSNIIGRRSGLNAALRQKSFDEDKKRPHFQNRPSKYNREVSAAIEEIRPVFPIATLARGDWAARELLRNKFQNALAAAKRRQKKKTLVDPSEIPGSEKNVNYGDEQFETAARRALNIRNGTGDRRTGLTKHRAGNGLQDSTKIGWSNVESRRAQKRSQKVRTCEMKNASRVTKTVGTNPLLRSRQGARPEDANLSSQTDEDSDVSDLVRNNRSGRKRKEAASKRHGNHNRKAVAQPAKYIQGMHKRRNFTKNDTEEMEDSDSIGDANKEKHKRMHIADHERVRESEEVEEDDDLNYIEEE